MRYETGRARVRTMLLACGAIGACAASAHAQTAQPAPGGDVTLGKVSVSATTTAGTNGSTDPTATEGTGSYTTDQVTVGSKMPLSVHETPQSISVLTDQQIHDQNLFDFESALKQVPGIYVTATNGSGGGSDTIYSRGFAINNFQFDGGATYAGTLGGAEATNTLSFDMAEYDHLEVLRGADGMFAGAGDPSGTVNLVRKRPLDHFQLTGEVAAGSWDNFREMVDITGPLAFDGKLRARLVVSHEDNDFFYQVDSAHRTMVYGVVEADLTPTTLLTAGATYTWWHNVGGEPEIPLAQNGANLNLPTSFCACALWAGDQDRKTEIFAKLQQKIATGWTLNLNFTHVRQYEDQTFQRAYFLTQYTAYDMYTYGVIDNDQDMMDANVKGKFKLFGQNQDIVFGANWRHYDSYFNSIQSGNYGQIPIVIPNIYTFNPTTALLNGFSLTKPRSSPFGWGAKDTQWSIYGMARLSPVSFVHVMGGFRLSSYDDLDFYNVNGNTPIATAPHTIEHNIVTPYAGLNVDVTKQWTAYYSFTSIFTPQTNNFYGPPPGSKPLPPITGQEHELGIKGRLLDGKLNASVALYQIHQLNAAVQDPAYPNTNSIGAWGSCCFLAAGDLLSKGIDAEITGRILPGWQITASADYNVNHYSSVLAYGTNNANPINTLFPPILFKIWSTYRLPDKFKNFTIGGGVNGQTRIYGSGTVPTVLNPDGETFGCPCKPYQFRQGPFAILSLRAAWRFIDGWEAAVDVNNVFNTTYFTALTNPRYSNYYGQPRNFMFSVSAKY